MPTAGSITTSHSTKQNRLTNLEIRTLSEHKPTSTRTYTPKP
jgi:hypothetical protein